MGVCVYEPLKLKVKWSRVCSLEVSDSFGLGLVVIDRQTVAGVYQRCTLCSAVSHDCITEALVCPSLKMTCWAF